MTYTVLSVSSLFLCLSMLDGLQRVLGLEESMDNTLCITAQCWGWQNMTHGPNPAPPPLFFVSPVS